MSNNISIERQEVKKVKTGEISKQIHIVDDYAQDCISLFMMDLENFPDSDIDLLEIMVKGLAEKVFESPPTESIFDYIVENEKGVSIDGTYYDYDEVKQIFEKYWVNRED